jgi:hypothetical protein
MLMPSSMHDWLRLPSRIALLLGLGALSIAGAKAGTGGESDPGRDGARVPQHSAKAFGDLMIWSEGGRIYTSEAGKPAEELHLGDTAEADILRQLLGREAATAATPRVLRDRVILVGDGGAGLHWESQKVDPPSKPRAPTGVDTNKLAHGNAKPADQAGTAQASSLADDSKK